MARMILSLVFLLNYSVSAQAQAPAQQSVTVLSGEHDGFTRLVFQIDPTYPHEIRASPGLISVIFPDRALDLQLERLFVPLTRNRLLDVRQTISGNDTLIELDLACACILRNFAYLGEYIVLDIMDIPETANSDVEVASSETRRPRITAKNTDRSVYETARTQFDWLRSRQTAVAEPLEKLPSPIPDPPPIVEGSEAHDVANVKNVLLEQLTRAAEQGLIQIDGELPAAVTAAEPHPANGSPDAGAYEPPPIGADMPQMQAAPIDAVLADTSPAEAADAGIAGLIDDRQISVVTVFDRDDPPDQNNALNGATCPADAEFAVWDWVDDAPAFYQIADARAQLLGEFDFVDQAALARLARLYVGLGFGREALTVLSAYGPVRAQLEMLADLARAVDNLPPVSGGVLDQVRGCPGHPAIWHGVAFGIEIAPDEAGRMAIFEAFASLPINQRRLLGPRLAETLLTAGDGAAARRISDLVARAPGNHGPEQALASARLGLSVGADSSDREVLERLAAKGGPTGPEALALLVNDLVDNERIVPEDLLVDLELAHFQNRDGPVADLLLRSRVRALTSVNAADQALDLLAKTAKTSDHLPVDISTMTAAALEAYTPNVDQPDIYISRTQQHISVLSLGAEADQVRRTVARHYITLGLPGLARAALAPALARGNREAHLIAAEAFLKEGRPAHALESVAGFAGTEAAGATARARAMTGDYSGAARVLDGSNPVLTTHLDYAWLAGDWAVAARGSDASRNQLAEYMLARPSNWVLRRRDAGDVANTDQQPPTLQSAKTALDESAAVRDLIRSATSGSAAGISE